MQIVLATNNEDKIREIKNLLDDLPITILSRDDFLEFPDIEETGTTLKENALLKATGIAEFCDLPALADDTGLEVDALDGAPGVYSSRFAGDNVSYSENYEKLIADLKDVPPEKRTARFRTVIAIDWHNGETETVEGVAEGLITSDVSGEQGFGYDPVFYHTGAKKRFSEMTVEEKNLVSHRGLALQKIRDIIIERLNKFRQ